MEEFLLSIDNGSTGACTFLSLVSKEIIYFEMPIKKERSYTKKEQYVTRLDHKKFLNEIKKVLEKGIISNIIMERPLVNNGRIKNSLSAIRFYEATKIIFEQLNLPEPIICDSRSWQHEMLGKETKGRDNLKLASLHLGQELFPHLHKEIQHHKDADSIVMAIWYEQQLLKKKDN
jgi:hypothetical protein